MWILVFIGSAIRFWPIVVIIGSGIRFAPSWHPVIIWTHANLVSVGPSKLNIREIESTCKF